MIGVAKAFLFKYFWKNPITKLSQIRKFFTYSLLLEIQLEEGENEEK